MSNEFTYIDAHTHLNFDSFAEDRTDIIQQMKKESAGAINIGIDVSTSRASIKLARENDHIWASVGCHPTEVTDDFSVDVYKGLIKKSRPHITAVGECGLDYARKQHRSDTQKKLQHQAFEAQIQLAIEQELPLILHLRPQTGSMDAYEEGLDILTYYKQKYGDKLQGTAHFFVGDADIAKQFLDLDFFISATGVITFDKSLQSVFADLPIDHLLVETDAPFAAPTPHRGQRNSPLYIPDIISGLAAVTDTPSDRLAEQLASNTRRLFSL